MMEMMQGTVYIVEDDAAIRTAVSELLESAGIQTQRFSSAEEFVTFWEPHMIGCLVLDVRLPGMSGMELQSKLTESGVGIPIIIMTGHGDIPMVKKALKAGAIEFLTKPFQDKELLQAVEQAFVVDRARRHSDLVVQSIQERLERLTEREKQIWSLVTTGLTNREIAEKLAVSVVTVKLHRGQVMRKMRADSFADLVKMSEKIHESPSSL